MEYLNRESRDVPFGWLEALQSLARKKPKLQSEPHRLAPPAAPIPSAR